MDGRGAVHLTFTRFGGELTDARHFHARLARGGWSAPREILPALGIRDVVLETATDPSGRLHALWKGADGRYRHSWLEDG